MSDTILKSAEDFKWYKAALDVKKKYNHRHHGEPERYPCKVFSTYDGDDNGWTRRAPDPLFNHEFVYKINEKCPCCGHSREIWEDEKRTGEYVENQNS